jgi:FSR family fosmidomycin resistance protein-like MFS transporter
MNRRVFGLHPTILLLAGTHVVVDGFSNILAPLLPVIIANLHLSLAAAGTLQMCLLLSNSVAQLGFGHLADRWRPRLLLLAGPILSICVMPLVGIATTWWTLAGCLLVGGLGAAAFHPPAAAVVHRLGTDRGGLAMAVHISGGSLGFALGPVLFAPFVQQFGLAWLPLVSVPALVLLAVFLRRIPAIDRLQEAHEARGFTALRPYAKPLTLLYLIVVLRTLTAQAFSTFVAVLLVQRGQSIAAAGTAVAIYLFAAGVGGFTGGPLADRFGPRRVIVLSLVLAVPFLAVAPSLSGWPFVVVLATGGFLLQSTLPVNVTFGQRIAPISAATVSSLMMGFAWGTGGVCVPLVGMLADHVGIERALTVMAAVPLVAAALAWPLPAAPPAAPSPPASPATPIDPVAGHAPLGAD